MPLFLLSFLSGAKSVVSALLTFFSKPPGSYLGLVIVAGIAVWWFGQHEFNKGAASVKVAEAKAAAPIIQKQAAITQKIEQAFVREKTNDQSATQIRLVAVQTHITPAVNAVCTIDLGAIRVFNDATHGSVPDASAGADDSPTTVALSDIATIATENAGQYDIVAHQLIALQDWVQQQEANNK